jgi:hypothetical protein
MPEVGFEPTISVPEWAKTFRAIDRVTTASLQLQDIVLGLFIRLIKYVQKYVVRFHRS